MEEVKNSKIVNCENGCGAMKFKGVDTISGDIFIIHKHKKIIVENQRYKCEKCGANAFLSFNKENNELIDKKWVSKLMYEILDRRIDEEINKTKEKIDKILYVEEGSADRDILEAELPENIKVIVYRQGSPKPILEKI